MSRLSRTSLIAALLAVALPAAASAATWSAPAVLAPPPSGGAVASSPQSFVTGTSSLVVASDGTTPWLARGDARGAFAARTALGPSTASSAVDADLGPDGTLAAVWASGGALHVTVVPAGQAPRAPIDVSAPGATGAAVAVGPDGAITLAYRTKVGTTYAMNVATAAPGGAFGAPVTLESGSAGMDSPDVAAGAGGALAVTYRKILTRYRARVAVRPAGAPAFEAPETMPGGDQAVIRTQVAIGGDGHVVAGWVDGATAQYATRAPGAPAFAAPVKLDDGAFSIQLEATPQGGTAAAWAGSGSVRAAVRPPGGAFAAPVAVGTYTSPIVSDPAIAVAPSGTATVLYNDPADGAIRVADLGSPSAIVGYGAPAQANSPSIAQGASLTVAAWRDAGGGISAATRSDTAVAGSPGAAPAGPDRTKPKLTVLTRSRTVKVTRRTRYVTIKVRPNEPVSYNATADLMTRRGKRIAHAPTRPYTVKTPRSGTRSIRITLGSLAEKDLRRALKAGRKADLSIDLTASDRAGNATRKIVRLKLHG
jgi:hypothetical protein